MVYCTFLQRLIMSGKVRVFHLLRTSDRVGVKMPCSAEYAQCTRIRPVVVMQLVGLAKTTAYTEIKPLSSETSAIVLHFDVRRYSLLTSFTSVTVVWTAVICLAFIAHVSRTLSVTGSVPCVIYVCTNWGQFFHSPNTSY
jgi:hypothetical protein